MSSAATCLSCISVNMCLGREQIRRRRFALSSFHHCAFAMCVATFVAASLVHTAGATMMHVAAGEASCVDADRIRILLSNEANPSCLSRLLCCNLRLRGGMPKARLCCVDLFACVSSAFVGRKMLKKLKKSAYCRVGVA